MSDTSSEELSKFFEDILKNKELILEMVNTNILMYDEKIKTNKEIISNIFSVQYLRLSTLGSCIK